MPNRNSTLTSRLIKFLKKHKNNKLTSLISWFIEPKKQIQ